MNRKLLDARGITPAVDRSYPLGETAAAIRRVTAVMCEARSSSRFSCVPISCEPEGHRQSFTFAAPKSLRPRFRCPGGRVVCVDRTRSREMGTFYCSFYCSFYCAARYGGVRTGTAGVVSSKKPQVKGTFRYALVRAEMLIAHNPKVAGSNPAPATNEACDGRRSRALRPGFHRFQAAFLRPFLRRSTVSLVGRFLAFGAGAARRSAMPAASACIPGRRCW